MQCENHEEFVKVALNYGWELYEYGVDSSCTVGGDTPHLALIWLKPCAWDATQKIPVGCLCCTDIDEEILKWNDELMSEIDSRSLWGVTALPDSYPKSERPILKSNKPVSFLPPYRAR